MNNNNMSPQDMVQHLLDSNTPFDRNKVAMLCQVVTAMYSRNVQDRTMANHVMNEFKSNSDAWMAVGTILDTTDDVNTKYFALQILDDAVKTRWKILPDDQKSGIRNTLVQLVLQFPEEDRSNQQSQFLLTKLNSTLISIVKQEWRKTWQNFIPDICNSAKESQNKCENALNILRLLSEEIFDFSKDSIQSSEVATLKGSMSNEFSMIYELCSYVLGQAVQQPGSINPSLVKSCLKTLQAFLSWIPLQYIFDTELVQVLLQNFIQPPSSRIEAIRCFTEVAGLTFDDVEVGAQNACKERLLLFYCEFIRQISELTKNRSLVEEYKAVLGTNQQSGFEKFVQQLALAITEVVKNQLELIEQTSNTVEANQMIDVLKESVQNSLVYLVQLTNIPEDELFKICLDFWHFFAYDNMVKTKGSSMFREVQGMNIQGTDNGIQNSFMHAQIYPQVLEDLKVTMIDQMAKPKEVLVTIDENGEVEEEFYEDTATIYIYERMRETLIFLTNTDPASMDRVIQLRLDKLTGDKSFFSFDRLNKLCWALGSISGCMSADDENKFVVSVIKELLNLCENTMGKSNKAQVATDIMYVVGQFPNFLCSHWAFLKTVIKKLVEFMHEKHPGVQDMASETFLKISKLTKHMFVQMQEEKNKPDKEPYVFELIRQIPSNLSDLESHQKLMVYEGIGCMVSVEKDVQRKEQMIQHLLSYSNTEWQNMLNSANQDFSMLMRPDVIKQIDFVVKINQRVADSVGSAYLGYLITIFNDMMKVYRIYSDRISKCVTSNQNDSIVKSMKSVRRDILKLIQTYVLKESDYTNFNNHILPTLKELVNDYQVSHPNARDSEVLMLFATMIKRQGESLTDFLSHMIYGLVESTLEMIQDDFICFPEFREGFFKLVEMIIKHCTTGYFQLDADRFQTMIMTVLFAMRHEKPELMEIGLMSMNALNEILIAEPATATIFYKSFYTGILRDTLTVMTDYRHMSGFKLQGFILQNLIIAVSRNVIDAQCRILDSNEREHQYTTNAEFVSELLKHSLGEMFPNLNKVQIEAFVIKMFNTAGDWQPFKQNLRDLLISMKSFASTDDSLYQEEKEAAMKQATENEEKRVAAIPGMLRPIDQQTQLQQQGTTTQGQQQMQNPVYQQ